MKQKHIGEWLDMSRTEDREYIAENSLQKLEMTKEYSLSDRIKSCCNKR